MCEQHMRGHGSRCNMHSKTTSTFLFENLTNCLEFSSVLTIDVFSLALRSRLYLNGLLLLDFLCLELVDLRVLDRNLGEGLERSANNESSRARIRSICEAV